MAVSLITQGNLSPFKKPRGVIHPSKTMGITPENVSLFKMAYYAMECNNNCDLFKKAEV